VDLCKKFPNECRAIVASAKIHRPNNSTGQ
jgi:hypothetical protein